MTVISIKPAYLDLAGTCGFTALSESTVQALIRKEEFPKPRLLSGRRVAWLVRELEEWVESRPVSDLAPPPNTGSRKGKVKQPPAPQAAETVG